MRHYDVRDIFLHEFGDLTHAHLAMCLRRRRVVASDERDALAAGQLRLQCLEHSASQASPAFTLLHADRIMIIGAGGAGIGAKHGLYNGRTGVRRKRT
jgi:hypothetical protein